MLTIFESKLVTIGEAPLGHLIFRPGDRKDSSFAIAMVTPKGDKGLFDLSTHGPHYVDESAIAPLLDLGQVAVRYDLHSFCPINDFLPPKALVVTPESTGLYQSSHRPEFNGFLVTFDGRYIDHQQTHREVGFTRYELGIMRGDEFVVLVPAEQTSIE